MDSGTSFGPYEIREQLGKGGMGEVYRAHDANLGRDVAIKVLPAELLGDAERSARFQREARLLASLNHPNIAAIYGVESSAAGTGLVLELVEGETLADRLERGPLPVDEALKIALQLAEAMEFAHERGIVHRDLKPANISLGTAPDGGVGVKVLDFGLARALTGDTADDPSGTYTSQESPTMSIAATQAGVIMGTAAYMSPEQAKGKSVDRRADIWAFGVVLAEMLTGERMFTGETPSEVMAAVIMKETDLDGLPAAVPPAVQRLLGRCLEKRPRRRLRDIGEARILLEDTLSGTAEDPGSPEAAGGASGRPSGRLIAALGIVSIALGAALAWWAKPEAEPMPVRRFELPAPTLESGTAAVAVIAPDGSRVAYVANGALYVHDLADGRADAVTGNAVMAFWSPDGRWLAYAAGADIYRVPAQGGSPEFVASTPAAWSLASGGVWREDGTIWFTAGNTGILAVSASGGDVRDILPPAEGEADFHNISGTSDGGVLFVVHLEGNGRAIDYYDGVRRIRLLERDGLSDPTWSPTGHLVYHVAAELWAVRYSPGSDTLGGEPFRVALDARYPTVAADGTLTYLVQTTPGLHRLAWYEPSTGSMEPVGEPFAASGNGAVPAAWYAPAISPDGTQAVYAAGEVPTETDLWLVDLSSGETRRLSFARGAEGSPQWSPDGTRIVYTRLIVDGGQVQNSEVILQNVSDLSQRRLAADASWAMFVNDDRVIYVSHGADGAVIQQISTAPDAEPEPLLVDGAPWLVNARIAMSPDRRGLAFDRDGENGAELFVAPFPGGNPAIPVLDRVVTNMFHFAWSAGSDALLYSSQRRGVSGLGRIDVSLRNGVVVGRAREVDGADLPSRFDVSADGRFLVMTPVVDPGARLGVVVLQNWLKAVEDGR